ncbi:MAG: cyclase family protein [Nitrospira sp.]|nr:cyclase family protein [Nitrospira sp.]
MQQRVAARSAVPVRAIRWGLVGLLLVGGWHQVVHAASRLVDLTYSFDETTLVAAGILRSTETGVSGAGTADEAWYATGQVALSEHAGTHMDAPDPFRSGPGWDRRDSVEHLMGPAVVIDVRAAVAKERDYRLSPADLHRWEAQYGTIPNGAVVMMLTGWERSGSIGSGISAARQARCARNAAFPGFSGKQRRGSWWLNGISGIGIDTPSIDYGPSQDSAVHRIVTAPPVRTGKRCAAWMSSAFGATLIALPMKIAGGSGAPVRILGILPEYGSADRCTSCATRTKGREGQGVTLRDDTRGEEPVQIWQGGGPLANGCLYTV